jgi:hypothetical protein
MTSRNLVLAVFVAAGSYSTFTFAGPGPASEGYDWRTQDAAGNVAPISISITSPGDGDKTGNPAAHYVPINHDFTLTATAADCDSYRLPVSEGGNGQWYDYSDDVTSGNTLADHHMWWMVTSGDGSFPETSRYGATGTYVAPEYSAGSNLRDVTVQARAQDYQRNGDNLGDDGDAQANSNNFALKVWQVTVTVSQAGTKSTNNDATTAPTDHGGTDLGWVVPGTPAGAEGYYGNTEIEGSIPAGPGVVTGYSWQSFKKDGAKYKSGGTWHDITNDADWTADHPYATYQDQDSRHPNTTGTDVREVFMLDAPGFNAGATNDYGISSGWTDFVFDYQFKSQVMYGGKRISNECIWEVDFTLDVVAGKWHVVSHTP